MIALQKVEKMTRDFLAAHGGWRDAGSDVGALSFDRADDEGMLDLFAKQVCAAGHGVVNERDGRYIKARTEHAARNDVTAEQDRVKYGSMCVAQHRSIIEVFAPVAAGDRMNYDEFEHLISSAAHLLLDTDLPKTFRNFLNRLVAGDTNDHDIKRWMPQIQQMRECGALS